MSFPAEPGSIPCSYHHDPDDPDRTAVWTRRDASGRDMFACAWHHGQRDPRAKAGWRYLRRQEPTP